MRKLRIAVIDLISKGPTRSMYARVMHANLSSIMPQVISVWCEQAGHDVRYVCYTGFENLSDELPKNVDVVFIGAFTESAQIAYALSNFLRSRGAITALGGPHARCYPQDAAKYFDYVLGFTDKETTLEVLNDCMQHRPAGLQLSAEQQPAVLPGIRERWKFIRQAHRKAPLIKFVATLGSLGCPFKCSFCVDSVVPYRQLDLDQIKEDLRFLMTKFKRPHVGWHDPNFGIRFDDYMNAIEEAAPPNSMDFVAESTLSLLTEPRLKRLQKNGFMAILPGIESWFDHGAKSKTGKVTGMEKVRKVSEHVNMIQRYVPYVQTNFVFGLDVDEGPEPFELTKRFLDMTPGAFPAYSLLTAFGQTPPLNIEHQRAGRLIPFPFHFMTNFHAMNLKPKNYSWTDFYDYVIDVTKHSYSWGSIVKRFQANRTILPKLMNVLRSVSAEGFGRIKYNTEIRRRLDNDPQFRPFFDQETTQLPRFYEDIVRKDLGPFWDWLPDGALHHDPNAYLASQEAIQSAPSADTDKGLPSPVTSPEKASQIPAP
ncbi:MAG: B12-binding domain-containing radical SAM protein [Planctomycetota bacterium]